jgi:hypothetical protein
MFINSNRHGVFSASWDQVAGDRPSDSVWMVPGTFDHDGNPLDEEPMLHPEGTFKGSLVEWGEIKRTGSGTLWYMTGRFQTQKGVLFSTFSGMPFTLRLLKQGEPFYKACEFTLRVRHKAMNDTIYVSADAMIEGA